MFFVAALIAVPPINLLLLTILGVALLWWRPRVGRALVTVSVIGLTLFALPAISQSMVYALERGIPLVPPPDAPPQAIVVLGGDMSRGVPPGLPFDVGILSLERERAAARLAARVDLPMLISGGPLADGAEPISVLMARSMVREFHTPVTWTEERSGSTWENARYSAMILRSHGIRSVYVVTQPWHERRALLAFRHFDMVATAAPTQVYSPPQLTPIAFVPRANAWLDCYFALHEWIGFAYYALRD